MRRHRSRCPVGTQLPRLRAGFATLRALPLWVHATLAKQPGDPREASYTLDPFERAETHDPLWNAAQRELIRTGVMQNVVRML